MVVLDMHDEVDLRLPGDQQCSSLFANFRQLRIAILHVSLSMYQKANCKSFDENVLYPLVFVDFSRILDRIDVSFI
jgi:hypothetical protein